MSNEINKIITATGEKVFTNITPDSTGGLADSLWHIFECVDENYDQKLNVKEISIFNKKVQEYAAKDGDKSELSEDEARMLAENFGIKNTPAMKSLGLTNVDIVKMIMSYTSSEAMIKNIGEALHGKWYNFGFAQPNKELFEALFNELNETNIGYVWGNYPTSLSKDILLFYPENEATKFIDEAFQIMKNKADMKGVKIDTLTNQYSNTKDVEKKAAVIEEMASRIYTADIALMCVLKKANVDKLTYKDISNESKTKIENIATKAGAPITDDLYGDGVLGNTKTVNSSKMQLPAMKILPVLNKVLSNPNLKERAQACVRKEGNYLVVNFPNDKGYQVLAEEYLADERGRTIQDGVIGDGDMSNFVITIYDKLIQDGKQDLLKNEKALEQYIIKLITPEI